MENYNNEVFGFGSNVNDEMEQTTNFNYNDISGLGESNYENEDLFTTEVDNSQYNVESFNDINNEEVHKNIDEVYTIENNSSDIFNEPIELNTDQTLTNFNEISNENLFENTINEEINQPLEDYNNDFRINGFNNIDEPIVNEFNEENKSFESTEQIDTELSQSDMLENVINEEPAVNESALENSDDEVLVQPIQTNENEAEDINLEQPVDNNYAENFDSTVEEPEQLEETVTDSEEFNTPVENEEDVKEEISISDTPIEELNELTHYEVDPIEETDINSLFDKVSVNVKDASDIFRKNTDLKQKIDKRFEELKKLQSEIENSRKKQIDEINSYKEEVLNKLTEKKEEIEKRLNLLKESQATFEKEKQEFEQYKKKEQENIDNVQKEVQSAYDDRREELNHIEDVLRKQKDALDEERSQLTLDRIQYESDKNELANNLLKFNEIVNSFTNGVNEIKE